MKIYCDGIFDLFHAGHITTFKYIKNMDENVHLIVGLISDDVASSYKRRPIVNEVNRQIMLESCVYVDEVVPNAPLLITKDFMDLHSIDLVVHSFSNLDDSNKQMSFFKIPKELGQFKHIPYSDMESTSDIIKRICYVNKQ